jgi:hypothetical protein
MFALLKKGAKFEWKAEQDIAFQQAKDALAGAPILGHPIQGRLYRLYTDASDFALGASLQQIQPVMIRDLKGTAVYDRLRGAWDANLPVPRLFVNLTKDVVELETKDVWAEEFEDTTVHVERVIAYWSRTLKPAERNYSATEREALGAKDALVKFQPFIEGETVVLVTDHAALQWARVYENANRRLVAWGAVYAAYPGLRIVHRAGRVHSNVDPLSRLPRIPPHDSPLCDDLPSIVPDDLKQAQAQVAEDKGTFAPAKKAAFIAMWWEDVVAKYEAFAVLTRQQARKQDEEPEEKMEAEDGVQGVDSLIKDGVPALGNSLDPLPFPSNDPWMYPTGVRAPVDVESNWEERTHLLLSIKPELLEEFVKEYKNDSYFRRYYVDDIPSADTVLTPSRFQKGENGLLYFLDADWKSCLCVPRSQVPYVLSLTHDSASESAHAGPRRYLARVKELFYWPSLTKDMDDFTGTCDVCQKIKEDRLRGMGGLRPAHIPLRPFATVSMDLITGLPPSGDEKFTAILVIVDKLTKYAIIVPTYNQLSQEGFAKIFVERVVNIFGLPERIICDRDKRWATSFWRSVVSYYGGALALSSSHHPQTDGQTEVLNATIEQMLRAYVASDRSTWARWLSEITHAYNSSVHSSTGYTPDLLLLGYQPRVSTALFAPQQDPAQRPFLPSQKAEDYIAVMEFHCQAARDVLALAQERQARAYNKHRRAVVELEPGDLVTVNPHSMKLVDATGLGVKLIQRTIGPFEVMERINPVVYRLRLPDNYPMHSVINLEHLKRYAPSSAEFGERVALPPTRDILKATEEYEVEAILGHRLTGRKDGNRRQYLVRWKGYDPSEDTWVSELDLRNAPEVKREYLAMHQLAAV